MSYGSSRNFFSRSCSNEPASPTPLRSLKRAKPTVDDAFPPSQQSPLQVFCPSSPSPFGKSVKSARRRLRFGRLPSPETSSPDKPLHAWSDQEFSFNTTSPGDVSEAESLPELTEDSFASSTSSTNVSPLSKGSSNLEYLDLPLAFKASPLPISFTDKLAAAESASDIKWSNDNVDREIPVVKSPSIFDIPELVHKIIEYADYQNTIIPREKAPIRRKPLSFRHALMIHGNEHAARLAMAENVQEEVATPDSRNVLHSCLLVNKLFHRIAKELMSKRMYFTKEASLCKYIDRRKTNGEFSEILHPKMLVLNQLFYLKQSQFNCLIDSMDYSELEWLELFMCPKIAPSTKFLNPGLKTIIVTGSKAVDDNFLVQVAQKCPNLEVLDVRACDNVTDYGVYAIGTGCTKLTLVNLGRKKKGHLITDHSVSALVCNNRQLQTAGLAGCYITDRSVWQLALKCGAKLQRLSLNNCPHVTDQSIPMVFQYNLFQALSVLELRFVYHITNFEPIIAYQRRQAARGFYVLVETCEELLLRMKQQEARMNTVISHRIVRDIVEWANGKDEDDVSYARFMNERGIGQTVT